MSPFTDEALDALRALSTAAPKLCCIVDSKSQPGKQLIKLEQQVNFSAVRQELVRLKPKCI
jgi:hypothetical protein